MTEDHMDDTRDGILFRFWIKAASYPGGWPSRCAQLIQSECQQDVQTLGYVTPMAYRRALTALAAEKGVNLPCALWTNHDPRRRIIPNDP